MTKCSECKKKLTEEEIQSPYKDEFNNILCDECYSRQYETVCPLCEEVCRIDEIEDSGHIGRVLIIQQDAGKDYLPMGAYEIVGQFSIMTTTELNIYYNKGVKRLNVPVDKLILNSADDWEYVCDACSEKLKGEVEV